MNITVADVDIIAQAAEAVTDDSALAEELLAIVDRFWGDYEPTPPVYDGPYGPDNPAPGMLA